jgi:hypothetical protein
MLKATPVGWLTEILQKEHPIRNEAIEMRHGRLWANHSHQD